ncbi:hypothetical protein [Streptosporangium sp. NPDC003464]
MRRSGAKRIATLGPERTSSELAADYILERFLGASGGSVNLYPSFEKAFDSVLAGHDDLLVVPHAYGNINYFYTEPRAAVRYIFLHETPPYGLVTRRGRAAGDDARLTVACHSAVLPLLDRMLERAGHRGAEITVMDASSNSVAAQSVHDGLADMAITNGSSADHYDLEFTAVHGPLDLSWTVFSGKD